MRGGFAERLNLLCERRGLPARGRQAAIARLCGVKPSSVNKWFSSTGLPDAEHMLALSDWGKVRVEWLLAGRGLPEKSQDCTLMWICDDEQQLLSRYRQCEPAEKRQVLAVLDDLTQSRKGEWITSSSVGTYQAA